MWVSPHVTAIPLGRWSPKRLDATYPHALRNHINACLFGIAARRDCPFHPWGSCRDLRHDRSPRLVSVALILTLGPSGLPLLADRWRGVTSYAVLCSPDVPPAHPFESRASGGLVRFTKQLSLFGSVEHSEYASQVATALDLKFKVNYFFYHDNF